MDFARVIYEVVQVDRFAGLICVKDENGEKIEMRITIKDNKELITEIKEGDKLEVEVNGWQVKSIRKINPQENMTNAYNIKEN